MGLDSRATRFPGADGTRVALPIWVDFLQAALPGTPRETFQAPEGMDWVEMDRVTGLLAAAETPGSDRVRLAFKPGTAPAAASTAEAVPAMRETRARARFRPAEDRVWGRKGPRLP